MLAQLLQEQARAEVKAALLALLAAHADEDRYPTGVSASFQFDAFEQEGHYEITVQHGKTAFPTAGGSL